MELKSSHAEIPLITIHDGIATTIDNRQIVQESMERILQREIGIKANGEIKYSKWVIGTYP